MKTWRKLSLRRCQNESNCGAWISTLSQNAPERMECCCRSLPETEEAEKPLSILRKNSINLFPWKKTDALYNSLYENGRQEINLKTFRPEIAGYASQYDPKCGRKRKTPYRH